MLHLQGPLLEELRGGGHVMPGDDVLWVDDDVVLRPVEGDLRHRLTDDSPLQPDATRDEYAERDPKGVDDRVGILLAAHVPREEAGPGGI